MAYTINKTNGSVLTTVADGTTDNTTDLTLIGKNYSGYGEILNENVVKLLENFANSSQPASPLAGQLWWDTTNKQLKAYTGTLFKVISGATSGSVAPSSPVAGDLWWDSSNAQLKVYSGTSWILIGPQSSSGAGTSGSIVDTVVDTFSSSHVVVKLYVNEEIVAIISKDSAFSPLTAIPGFATIYPGITMSTATAGATFRGTAYNADYLGNVAATNYLLSNADDSTTGTLSILKDAGLYVGADSDIRVYVAGNDGYIANQNSDGELYLRVNRSVGGYINGLTIDGATGVASLAATPSANDNSLKIATTAYVDNSSTGFLKVDGSKALTGNLLPNANATINLGSSSFRYNYVYATATTALYADLAECFAADQPYEPGTVVALGGAAEITAVAEELSDQVFGVISTRPAYLMNSGAGDETTHPPVAMTGRVPVKVVGRIKKGDRLVSAGNGLARAAKKTEVNSFNTFGRSLEDKTTDGEGTVVAVVTIN